MHYLRPLSRALWEPMRFLKDHPVLFRSKTVTIVGFGVFASLETMVMLLFFGWFLSLHGVSPLVISFSLYLLGGVLVWGGAKVFHWVALGKKFWKNPVKYIKETGFYMQGGVIGATLWLIVVARETGISFSLLADALCWGGLIGQVIGRLGCFNYGCCFGKPVTRGPGVSYMNADSKIVRWKPQLRGVRVHPTQLYLAGLHLILFVAIWVMLPKLPVGFVFIAFLIWHGVTRMVVEQVRFDLIHHEGRNWTTWYTAILMALSSGVLALILHFIDNDFLQLLPLTTTVSPFATITFLSMVPPFTGVIMAVGLLIFLGYGIHGNRLGTFPIPAAAPLRRRELSAHESFQSPTGEL